jgi:hypothetical protein
MFCVVLVGMLEHDEGRAIGSIRYAILCASESECFFIGFHELPDTERRLDAFFSGSFY